jgi:hypothetical protein
VQLSAKQRCCCPAASGVAVGVAAEGMAHEATVAVAVVLLVLVLLQLLLQLPLPLPLLQLQLPQLQPSPALLHLRRCSRRYDITPHIAL